MERVRTRTALTGHDLLWIRLWTGDRWYQCAGTPGIEIHADVCGRVADVGRPTTRTALIRWMRSGDDDSTYLSRWRRRCGVLLLMGILRRL